MLPTIKWDRDAFGSFAEGFARFMGTARFLLWMTVIIVVWVLWNLPYGPPRPRFDQYPFIFLTLVLSLQASYAAPLILLAQNRQEARDRVATDRDALTRLLISPGDQAGMDLAAMSRMFSRLVENHTKRMAALGLQS